MNAPRVILLGLLSGACAAFAQPSPPSTPATALLGDTAYAAHEWFALRDAIRGHEASALHRGAVACAFEDAETARRIFGALLDPGSKSGDAFDAHQWLSYVYLRTGQYRRGLAELDAMAALRPDNAGLRSGQLLFRTLSIASEQTVMRRVPVTVNYKTQMNALFAPVRVNGRPAHYFLDTGANVSMISEGEAKRTGMTFHTVGADATKVVDATGAQVGFRIAVADEIAMGEFTIRNVAFMVFPDDHKPWSTLPEGERGGLGISVWLALRTLRVHRDGRLEAGFPPASTPGEPNLAFDGATPILRAGFSGQRIPVLLDTGASTTDFWPPFARDFAVAVNAGKSGARTISGVGSTEKMDTRELAELKLEIGGFNAVRRPAHVLIKENAAETQRYYARLGWDMVSQATTATFDYQSMTLRLE